MVIKNAGVLELLLDTLLDELDTIELLENELDDELLLSELDVELLVTLASELLAL